MADKKITQEDIKHKLKREITELEEKKRDTKKDRRNTIFESIVSSAVSVALIAIGFLVATICFDSEKDLVWDFWLLFEIGLIFSVPGDIGASYFLLNNNTWKEERMKKQRWVFVAFFAIGKIALVAVPLFQQDKIWCLPVFAVFLFVFCFCFVMAALSYDKCSDLNKELRHLENDIREKQEELELSDLKGEDRAVKLFMQNKTMLYNYYQTNLIQQRSIFVAGIIAMGIGAAIIIITLLCKNNMQEQMLSVLAGTGSGALISVIGAIITGMYTDTTKASIKLHGKLAHTQDIFFANMLAEKIKDDESLTNETLSGMAKGLLSNRQESEEKVERE